MVNIRIMKTVLTIIACIIALSSCKKDLVIEPQKEVCTQQDTSKTPTVTDSIGDGDNQFGEF